MSVIKPMTDWQDWAEYGAAVRGKHPTPFRGIDFYRDGDGAIQIAICHDKPVAAVAATKRPRRVTLTSVAKEANKAGIEVARYEIDPDGKITIVTGKAEAEQTNANDLDKWISTHAN